MTRPEQSKTLVEMMQSLLGEDEEDLLAEIVRLGLQAIMEAERDLHVGVDRYKRSEERQTSRNGYKPRQWTTRVGRLDLMVPQTRDGKFSPQILERYQRSEGALVAALAEAYVAGVSTRKMKQVTEKLLGKTFSSSTISRYAARLDEELEPWRTRRLEKPIPYIIVDARYEKCRRDGQIVDLAVLVATGVDVDGYRQVVGIDVAWGETTLNWKGFFEGLIERGLHGVQLVAADAHEGLKDARRQCFPGVPWQRCQVHFMRNLLEKVPKKHRNEIYTAMRGIWDLSRTRSDAEDRLNTMISEWEKKLPEFTDWLDDNARETLAVLDFPNSHWVRLRTTNGLERIMQELIWQPLF
jgi:transposase-like protein